MGGALIPASVFLVTWWFTLHFVLTMILRFFDFSNLQPILPELVLKF